jgi:PAS domain S-box-containing protein
LYDFAPVGYFTLDSNGLILTLNQTGAKQLDRSRRRLMRKPFWLYVAPDSRRLFFFHCSQVFETKTHQTCEIPLIKEDGTLFWARLESIIVPDSEGKSSQFRTALIDITEQVRMATALRKAHQELEVRVEARTAELSNAVAKLEEQISERRRAEAEKERLFQEVSQQREQLRGLTRQLAEAQEVEWKRLARELHDQIGQTLTALDLNLNLVRVQFAETGLRASLIESRLDDSLALVTAMGERIRNVMADLHPPMLDDYGLVEALRWYGSQLAARAGFSITVQGEEPVPRLTSSLENALFRIAQEALTNVAKHAQASQVTVTVKTDNDTIRLVIADDGIGFEPGSSAKPFGQQGWGVLIMIERAEAIGGHCRIESQPGQGTRVVVEVIR